MNNNDAMLYKSCQKLAEDECANCENGRCLLSDQPCRRHLFNYRYKIIDGAINCDYFIDAVLPSDEELNRLIHQILETERDLWTEDEIAEDIVETQLRRCIDCGKHFIPASNRQKRCKACGAKATKSINANSHRQRYWANK